MAGTDPAGTGLELRVRAVRMEAENVVSVELADPCGRPLPPWQPGGHLELVLPSGLVRQYSLCGDPADRGVYLVAVLREEAGRGGSREIHDTGLVGRMLLVRGPRNRFELVDAPAYLFISGGIGITPLLPMIGAVARRPPATWWLHYGGRTRRSMAFTARLTDLATASDGSVTLVPEDEAGRLDLDAILSGVGPGTAIYCCGPAGLIAAVEQRCAALGVLPGLHVERFTAPAATGSEAGAPGAAAEAGPPFEVQLHRTGVTLTVDPGESILRSVRRVLPDVLSSCEEGYCASCEVRVLDGLPDHRDTVLSDSERAANETMFICVSRSRSPRLVLDL